MSHLSKEKHASFYSAHIRSVREGNAFSLCVCPQGGPLSRRPREYPPPPQGPRGTPCVTTRIVSVPSGYPPSGYPPSIDTWWIVSVCNAAASTPLAVTLEDFLVNKCNRNTLEKCVAYLWKSSFQNPLAYSDFNVSTCGRVFFFLVRRLRKCCNNFRYINWNSCCNI